MGYSTRKKEKSFSKTNAFIILAGTAELFARALDASARK